MKQIITVILYIFIFINISKSVKTPDYSCMNSIISVGGIDKSSFPLDSSNNGEYDFCLSSSVVCDIDGFITSLSLKSTNKIDFLQVPINCLSRLDSLTLDSFGSFSGTTIQQSVRLLSLLQIDSIKVDQLNNIQEIYIKTDGVIAIINLSTLSKINKFTHIQVSEGSTKGLVTFNNDLTTQINLDLFSFTAREIPNLGLVGVNQLQINYLYGTNETSIVDNFKTFSLVKNLKLRNILGNTAIPFPDQLFLMQNGGILTSFISDNAFSSLNGKLDLSKLSSLEYFSISSSGTSNLRDTSPSNGFPFSLFPNKLIYFELNNQATQAKIGSDVFLKSNLKTVILRNDYLASTTSALPSSWPSSTITTLDVSNNPILMSGVSSLDSSYCNVDLSCSGSGYSASIALPSCFTCHFGDSNYKLRSFKEATNSPICTTLVPKALESKKDGKIVIVGQDLGFDGSWITSNIVNSPSWIVDINSKQIHAQSSYEGVFNITYSSTKGSPQTFTLTNLPQLPSPSTISSTSSTITIKGSYFSYVKEEVQVYLGSSHQNCSIISSTFYEIVCSYQYVGSIESSSYIKVGSLTSPYFTIKLLQDNSYSSCPSSCPSNRCNLDTGLCSCEPLCKNGGVCSSSGTCNCSSTWGGSDCSVPIHYINAIKETTIDGGYVYLYGFFGTVHDNPSVVIGSQPCAIQNITESTVVCFVGKGEGQVKLNMTQNNYSYVTDYRFINPIKECPNNCSGIGTCNTKTSECTCPSGYSGSFDCSIKDNSGAPGTSIDHGESGSTSFLNENTNFSISVISLVEVTVDGQEVSIYPLSNSWSNRSYSNGIYSYGQPLSQGSNISLMIQEIKEDTQINFADDIVLLKKNSLKISLSIKNYQFKSSLNTLKLLFSSTVVSQSDECNKQDFNLINYDGVETSNMLVIQKDKKYLYGSFYKKVVSDGRATFSPSNVIKNDINSSVIVELSLPHCVTECIIDPDFSLLVSNDFESKCEKRAKWVLPVAIVVPVVGLSAIIIVSAIIYKKNKVALRVMRVKLRELNKSSDNK